MFPTCVHCTNELVYYTQSVDSVLPMRIIIRISYVYKIHCSTPVAIITGRNYHLGKFTEFLYGLNVPFIGLERSSTVQNPQYANMPATDCVH